MGGGKETPRQKMIGMMYLVLTALLAMNVSKQVLKGYVTVNESIVKSRENLKVNNKNITEAFQQAIGGNPGAAPYYAKALEVQKLVTGTIEYIDKLRGKVIEVSEGFKGGGDTTSLKWTLKNGKIDAYDDATHLLIGAEPNSPKSGEWSAKELRGKIDVLVTGVVSIMDNMQKDPKTKLYPADYDALKKKVMSLKPVGSGEEEEGIKMDWEAENFYHLPEGAVVCNLNRMAADLRSMEAEMLGVFSSASGKLAIKFDHIVARVVAPSSYIQAGSPYEADIFLAASSSKLGQGDMEIMIGVDSAGAAAGGKGSSMVPLANGEGKYTIGTGGQGEQTYKGVIKYKNPDGTFKYYPFGGTYMVAAPALAVSAEQMKVFYVGVDNPILVSAAGIAPTELKVSASGGGARLTPSGGGKFMGRFTTPGECIISATDAKGKSQGTSKFKVKPLPKPELKIASKFSPMELRKGEIALVGGVGAGANGFEFQANFVVQSWEVTGKAKGKLAQFQGNGPSLSAEAQGLLKSLDVGSKVYIEAKVKGPDGKVNSATCGIKVTK